MPENQWKSKEKDLRKIQKVRHNRSAESLGILERGMELRFSGERIPGTQRYRVTVQSPLAQDSFLVPEEGDSPIPSDPDFVLRLLVRRLFSFQFPNEVPSQEELLYLREKLAPLLSQDIWMLGGTQMERYRKNKSLLAS